MNLDLINERYTDHRYHSYHLLKEHWNSYTDDDKRFIKECENITNSVFPELLEEAPFDKFKSKAAGAWTGAKNLKKSLTGKGAETEDVGQAKINKRVQLFQNNVGKVLGELKRDLGKMGIEGEDHPTIQAMTYITGSANQIGTEQYPIEVKAGLGGRMADKALEWTNKKVQDLLTKIKAEADKQNTFSGSQEELDAINKERASKMMPPLVKQLQSVQAAGKALKAIEKFGTEHPKWTNFIIGVLVAASRLVGLPGSGIIVGLLLRSAVGVIKGEDIQQAVGSAAKVATVGALAGAAIGELGDALSDNSDQVAGEIQQAAADAGDATDVTVLPDDWAAQRSAEMVDSYHDQLEAGRALGIPDHLKMSFYNGQLHLNIPQELLQGDSGTKIIQSIYNQELARIQLDDWLPSDQRLSTSVLGNSLDNLDRLQAILNARNDTNIPPINSDVFRR